MTAAPSAPPPAAPAPRAGLLLRWLGKAATVTQVAPWSEHFRLIEVEGPALRQAGWKPGHKVQIPLAGMRVARTYTPIHWDLAAGRARWLAFLHGQAPGSDWARTVAPGAVLQLIGPRRSVELPPGAAPVLLFGDETALGLADAWLLPRQPDDAHLQAVETQLALHAGTDAQFVLAGRAPAVQRLHRALKRMGVRFSRVQTRAYWAPGKTGLD